MYKIRIAFFVILFLSILGFSCKKNSPTTNPVSNLLSNSGCKQGIVLGNNDTDSIYYSHSGNILTIYHFNAAFNCCPKSLFVNMSLQDSLVTLDEREILITPCKCSCLYDISYKMENIPLGIYTIYIKEPYIIEPVELLQFKVDLSIKAEGGFSVKRTNYPWSI